MEVAEKSFDFRLDLRTWCPKEDVPFISSIHHPSLHPTSSYHTISTSPSPTDHCHAVGKSPQAHQGKVQALSNPTSLFDTRPKRKCRHQTWVMQKKKNQRASVGNSHLMDMCVDCALYQAIGSKYARPRRQASENENQSLIMSMFLAKTHHQKILQKLKNGNLFLHQNASVA